MNFNYANSTAAATTGGVVCVCAEGTVAAAGAAVEDTMSLGGSIG